MTILSKSKFLFISIFCWISGVNAQSNTTVIRQEGVKQVRPAMTEKGATVPLERGAPSNAVSQQWDKVTEILGVVHGDTKGHNQIYFYSKPGEPKSSALIENGKFRIRVPFNGPVKVMLYTQYETAEKGMYSLFALLLDQPGVVNVDMNISEGFRSAQISGLPTTVAYNRFTDKYQKALMAVYQDMNQKTSGQPTQTQRDEMDNKMKAVSFDLLSEYLNEDNHSFVAGYVLTENKSMLKDKVKPLYDMLSPAMKNSTTGKDLLAFSKSFDNKILDGDQLKNFTLPDANGKEFIFDQLKGKYVWIDFWASWCYPCRMAFPSMRKLYEQYKGKNFEIVGISTDKGREDWLKAVKQDNNPWIQLWDNASMAAQFSVSSLPRSFLIGPDGKIIMSESGFDPKEKSKIEKKLEEIYHNK